MKPGERLEWNMTRDESLVFGSTMSDFKFLLEHEVSVLEIALAAVSFEDCSLDGSVPLDRVVVAYDYWLGALDALHPGHDFRRFGLSDLELSDDDLLGRLLSTVLFDDGGSCRFIRSVVDGAYAGLSFCLFSVIGLGNAGWFHPPPGCELQFVHGL